MAPDRIWLTILCPWCVCVTACLRQRVEDSPRFSVDTTPVPRPHSSIGGGGSGIVVAVATLLVPLRRLLLRCIFNDTAPAMTVFGHVGLPR